MRVEIAGKVVKFNFEDNKMSRVLKEELSAYKQPKSDLEEDINVYFESSCKSLPLGTNPSTHVTYLDGFLMKWGCDSFHYQFGATGLVNIYINWSDEEGGIKKWRRKWRSIEYADKDETIGRAIHELVLVPIAFFESNLAPIHSSGMVCPNTGKLAMIGGTGGVGKTSLELILCGEKGYGFFADDVTIVDSSGIGYANMAYPKIYGYNLKNENELKSKVFLQRKLSDMLQWEYVMRRRGSSKVRRRVDPRDFYDDVVNEPTEIGGYYVLARCQSENIEMEELSIENAVTMSIKIMESEYGSLFNHLHWWEYNLLCNGKCASWPYDQMLARWRRVMSAALTNTPCYLVKLPLEVNHVSMKTKVSEMIDSTMCS